MALVTIESPVPKSFGWRNSTLGLARSEAKKREANDGLYKDRPTSVDTSSPDEPPERERLMTAGWCLMEVLQALAASGETVLGG
jgi:hypothetical protein